MAGQSELDKAANAFREADARLTIIQDRRDKATAEQRAASLAYDDALTRYNEAKDRLEQVALLNFEGA